MSLSRKVKKSIKIFIGKNFNLHKHQEKDIFLFATRRSGSMWLMSLIYSQPNIKYSNQPINDGVKRAMLPKFPKFKVVELDKHDKKVLKKYFTKIIHDKIQASTPWNILSSDYSFFTHRYIVKICNAHSLINWFNNNFNIKIIYLIRHPIPISLSIIKRGWINKADVFLRKSFAEKYLTHKQINYAKKLLKEGSMLEKFVLEWCLENFVPLRSLKKSNKNWIVVSYEEMAINPVKTINLLAKRLNLKNKEKMIKKIKIPSQTTQLNSIKKIKSQTKKDFINFWKKQIPQRQEEKVMKILNIFKINAYAYDSCLPASYLLNYPIDTIKKYEQ